MAAIGSVWKNVIEWSKHFHKGKVLPEINILAQMNHAVMDMPWTVCNDGTTHLYRVKTKLPTASKTRYGEGTPESKGQATEERAACTMLTGFSTVPRETSKIGGATGQIRALEDADFAESLKQLFGKMEMYGNRNADDRDIYGFATLYNSLSGNKAKNVINCLGTTNNGVTSGYLVCWGRDVYGIFPEGTTAGYTKEDLGLQVKTLANGNQLVVLQTEHVWHVGLVIEAWPQVVRLCNVEVAHAIALNNTQSPTSTTNFIHKVIDARMRIRRPGTMVLYVNDVLYALIMHIAYEKSNAAVTIEKAITQFGTFDQLKIMDIAVRRQDQILSTEQLVA